MRTEHPDILEADSATQEKQALLKHPYSQPTLRVFGSVKALTLNNGGSQTDGVHVNHTPSEWHMKENIVRVGDHPSGFGLYLFDYKPAFRERWGHGRQFGVMADEVATVVPEAVRTHTDGYRLVHYPMLGIERHCH